tara:strand:+ start:132 stop:494 length:363 start_codon:yes stop_codon:yes gene_type:complete
MEKIDVNWRLFSMYMLIIFFMLLCSGAFSQVTMKCFNAEWNKANNIEWVHKLSDIKTISYIDVGKDKEAQAEYKIAVIPTIIIFKDSEEVARFQADLSFKMVATREEVQEEIDNILMSDF